MKKVTWKNKSIRKCVAWILVFALMLPLIPLEAFAEAEEPLETLNPTLEQITFSDFAGIQDGEYTEVDGKSDFVAWGYYNEGASGSLAGKVLTGDVTIGQYASLWVGGTGSWDGLYLMAGADGNLTLGFGGEHTLTPAGAKATQLVGTQINLKLSYQIEGTKLLLGVWINNRLYDNTYFELEGEENYAPYLYGSIRFFPRWGGNIAISSQKKEALSETLSKITFTNFGVNDGEYGKQVNAWVAEGSYGTGDFSGALSGKVIQGNVTFCSSPMQLYIGGLGSYDGLMLYRDWGTPENALYLSFGGTTYTLTKDLAGVDLVGEAFDLKLSYEEEDCDNDGNNDRLKLGVWIGNKLYNNAYFYAKTSYAQYLYGRMRIFCGEDANASIKLISTQDEVNEVLNELLPKITFSDFNVQDGEYGKQADVWFAEGSYGTGDFSGALSGKVIQGEITFSSQPMQLYIGGEGTWDGLMLYRDWSTPENALYLSFGGTTYTLTKDLAGVDLVGEAFDLKLSYEEEDSDNDGNNDRLKLGVWIGNKLYDNAYFYAETSYAQYLYGRMRIYCGDANGSIKLISAQAEVLNEALPKITFSDFNVQDGIYSGEGCVAGDEYHAISGIQTALAGKVVQGNVEFSSDTAKLRFGFETDSTLDPTAIWATNLQLWRKGDDPTGQLRLSLGSETEADTYILTSEIAKADLVGNKFHLQLSFQEEDSNHDGTNDRLKLGVWINNVLYNNEYFYVTDRYERFIYGWMMVVDTPSPGYVILSSIIDTDLSETTMPTEYETVTPFDFGVVYNTYPGPGVGAEQADYKCNLNTESPLASMDKVLFRTKITFDASTQFVYMRTSSSEWNGLAIRVESDGSFYLVNYLTDNFEIWGGAEKVATSESAWYYLNPQKAIDGATTLAGESFYLALTTEFVACDTDGEANDLKLGIWFNEKLYNQQYLYIKDCLDVCEQGVLLCRTSEGSIVLESPSTSKREETTERYNLGDGPYLISGTGTILVNDVEYQNGDTLTEPGTYRIVSDNGTFVRNVELYNTGKKSSVLAYEDNVMPIVGFFGPLSGTDADGNPYNSVSEETYRLLEAAKFNLINYIENDWSARQEGQKELIQNLIYAEAHNIGMYVWDSALLTSDLEADTIAKSIAPYSQYGSFKGMYVVDEPGTDSYYSKVDRQLDTYAPLAKAANGYCNLNGYINLFPYSPTQLIAEGCSASEYESRYGAYLDEYISSTKARLLSYDNYVFATSRPAYYFTNLRIAREKSLNANEGAGIPFWPYIAVGNNWVLDMGDDTRTPLTGEQFMWNVNTCLAYGAKGIQYYTLIQPYFESGSHEGVGVLDTNGVETDWYEHAVKINTHIAAIDEVLMAAESKAVLAIGTQAQEDTAISATSYGNLESVILDKTNTEGTVIGAFDYQGKDAFYVVNYDMEAEQTITLKFKGSNEYQYRLIQNAVTSYGEGNTCELKIPAGEAVLVVLNDYAISDMKVQAEITNSIAMAYTVTLDQELLQSETPYMSFEMGGEVMNKVLGVQKDKGSNVYTFTYPEIMVTDMAETIKATLSFGEYSKNYECSVLDYCAGVLRAESLTDNIGEEYTQGEMEDMKDLVVDLVQYGASVQTYANKAIADEDLLTSKMEELIPEYAEYYDKEDKTSLDDLAGVFTAGEKLSGGTENDSYKWTGATLSFKDKIYIRGRFTATQEVVNALTMKVSVDGAVVLAKPLSEVAVSTGNAGVWHVDFGDIYGYEYGQKISITFYNNDVVAGKTLNYSVNTYLNAKKDTADDALKNLLLCINSYGDAAVAFRATTQGISQ